MQGFKLPDTVKATLDLVEAASFGELILVVIPTPFVERVMSQLTNVLKENQVRWTVAICIHLGMERSPEKHGPSLSFTDNLQLYQRDSE